MQNLDSLAAKKLCSLEDFAFPSTNGRGLKISLSKAKVRFSGEGSDLSDSVKSLVTTKKTAIFKNAFWVFSYRSIKEPLFSDYEVHKKDWFSWYQATPEKALFDYFYLKRDFIFSIEYLNELRINWENVNLKKFEQLVNKYDSKKVKNILQLIKKALW